MECEATERDDVENVATPLPLRVPVPSAVAPSRKVTVPVGCAAGASHGRREGDRLAEGRGIRRG